MPLWAIIYLVFFVWLATPTREDFGKERKAETICNCIANILLAVLFWDYWQNPPFRYLNVTVAPLAFLALSWEICTSHISIRRIWNDPDNSEKERFGQLILGSLVPIPLYVTAGMGLLTFFR